MNHSPQKLLKTVELKAVLNKAKFVDVKSVEKFPDFLKENCCHRFNRISKKRIK